MSHPLGLELQLIVSHVTWLLGNKVMPSGKAKSSPNPWAISPAPYNSHKNIN